MAWKDLTINQKAQLMNIFRDGGVVSLRDMQRIYDQSLQPSLVETPYRNAYAGGGYVPSDDIKDYIKKTEAFRSNWYNDGNGIPTVGYGFTGKKVKELYPDGMTRAQADAYFDDLINRSAARMSQLTPNMDRLTQNQQDALFSYFYNIGEGNYSKGSPKMQQALQDFDLDTVVKNIDAGYNDTKNPGLKKRRDYERALFQSNIASPPQREPSVMTERYMYDRPEMQLPMVRTPYKEGVWSLANPFMYTPEEEYFAKGGNIVNKIRERLYNNVEPQSYNDAFHRVFNGVVLNKNMRNTNVGSNPRDALWAKYLNIPEDKNKLKYNDLTESPYTPTVGREGTGYYRLKLSDKIKDTIIEQASDLNFGETKNARIIDSLGTHTISKGLDPMKGEYVSYYDKWKIAPFFGGKRDDQSFGIGNPVNIYDRIYLDDYYDVEPQIEADSFYGGYIQPAIINKEGGKIYIKKKNRGKFTALKKRTGKSASWFKAHGTPAQKKMAVFALNSRHWGRKKSHGGILF